MLSEGPVYVGGSLVVSVDLGDDVVRMLLCELAELVLDDHGFARPSRAGKVYGAGYVGGQVVRQLLLRLDPAVNVCRDEVGPEEPFELLVLLSVFVDGLEQPTGLVLEALGLMLVAVLDGTLLGEAQIAAQALVSPVLRKALAVF